MSHDLKSFYEQITRQKPVLLGYQFLCTFKGHLFANGDSAQVTDAAGSQLENLTLLCQSASVPEHTMNVSNVNFFAKSFSLPATQQYTHEWKCKMLLTKNMSVYTALRGAILQYSNMYQNMGGQIRSIPNFNIELDILNQNSELGKNYEDSPRYVLVGAYPIDVGELSLKYTDGSSDAMTFDVKWAFQYSYMDRNHNYTGDVLKYNPSIS